ncbi:ATP-binding cassette domain-containing protein [Symbiobacterium thermophilum]|uniref:Ribose ABC transporter ATP-binding protein n=1 Tax=Symbiobacterium thermophilum (strain DSM 24528 / JCM 14929 / IAM 14863 / T) TaxID=292459 RepID=Q67RD5_SYMTH|nr:ATP-binding cassette domain-containing protein [Symbiobacterium thermophilum]BAD39758.1 ribose ABC transporter ATP-binding protein [Symbiobacterium thermophilum IAM 14863]
MPAAPVVEMRGIDRSFPGVRALKGVDFELRPGEVHGLLGENGAGKSTLMKILGGLYRPEAGEVLIDGRPVTIDSPAAATALGIAFIHQELNQALHLSVAENIYLGRPPVTGPFRRVDWRAMYQGAAAVLERLGAQIDPRATLGSLGVGARQMVEIARALSLDARVLIMDEPTAALTEPEVERLFAVMRSLVEAGVAIVYISHRLEEIFTICDRVTVLRDGQRIGSWPIDQVTADHLITHMVGRQLTERFPKVEVAPGDTLLEVRDLLLRGSSTPVSFTVRRGEILGIAGLMGAGRTHRGQGFHEAVDGVQGIDVVASQPADFDRAKGLTVMENILQAHPDIVAVFAHNDEMALGALEAIEAAGKADQIKVVGFDATDDAVKAVQEGRMAATVAQKPKEMGRLGVETALKHLNGEKVDEYIPVPLELVTK